ncbi:helix-turn-helix domain-containing protein, partial [Burkholderia stabilis]
MDNGRARSRKAARPFFLCRRTRPRRVAAAGGARSHPRSPPMDKLDQVRIFLQVAEMGSFIKAAHALDVPRATV